MSYMMDTKKKYWNVLGRLRSKLFEDHTPHPLTYSGFEASITAEADTTPSYATRRTTDAGPPILYRFLVQFNHKVLDRSLPRLSQRDFRTSISSMRVGGGSKRIVEILKVCGESDPPLSSWTVTSHLNVQYQIKTTNYDMKFAVLPTGIFPVESFDPNTLVRNIVSLFRSSYRNTFLCKLQTVNATPKDFQVFEMFGEVAEYFQTQEQFELLSICKRIEPESQESTEAFFPSLRELLRLKLDHLRALYSNVAEPLLSMVDSASLAHGRIRDMGLASDLIQEMSIALESAQIDSQYLVSLCQKKLTDYFPLYKHWWRSLYEQFTGEVKSKFFSHVDTWQTSWASSTTFLKQLQMVRWEQFESALDKLVRWIIHMRNSNRGCFPANPIEQDQVYMGSAHSTSRAHLFVPWFELAHLPRNQQLRSEYFFQNRLIEREAWPVNNLEGIFRADGLEFHTFHKDGTEHQVIFSNSTLKWEAMRLEDISLQSVKGPRRSMKDLNTDWQVGFSRLSRFSTSYPRNVDSGPEFLIIISRMSSSQIYISSEYPRQNFVENRADLLRLLPEPLRQQFIRDENRYLSLIHDPHKVFPMCYFHSDRVVLFAQLSAEETQTPNHPPLDVGVRLLALNYNPDHSFVMKCCSRFHSQYAYREDLRYSTGRVGWDQQRLKLSYFYFRWRCLNGRMFGLWIHDLLVYSLYLYSKGTFISLGKRGKLNGCSDPSTTPMHTMVGSDLPWIGMSRTHGVHREFFTLECWLYKLIF